MLLPLLEDLNIRVPEGQERVGLEECQASNKTIKPSSVAMRHEPRENRDRSQGTRKEVDRQYRGNMQRVVWEGGISLISRICTEEVLEADRAEFFRRMRLSGAQHSIRKKI